ncbi:uncharacterized protein PAC_18780 [Phialocephala subalpina]|uniref:Uncharacterized protein n=1 Tax=Phialocephala subalpina TaxID=576137 RepID=A0A1L7XV55_9HELO|nr:uncharacterized protein PAC_18780 [Phialocephala subalpina]
MCQKIFPAYTICGHNATVNADIVICFFDQCHRTLCRGIKQVDEEQIGLCPNCNAIETFKHCYWSDLCQIEFDHGYTDLPRLPEDDDVVLITPVDARCRRCEQLDLEKHPRDPVDETKAASQIPAEYEDLPRGSFANMQSQRPSVTAFVVPVGVEVEEFRSQHSAAMTKLPTKFPSQVTNATVERGPLNAYNPGQSRLPASNRVETQVASRIPSEIPSNLPSRSRSEPPSKPPSTAASREPSQIPSQQQASSRGSTVYPGDSISQVQKKVPFQSPSTFQSRLSRRTSRAVPSKSEHTSLDGPEIRQNERGEENSPLTASEALRRGPLKDETQSALNQNEDGELVREALNKSAASMKLNHSTTPRSFETRATTRASTRHAATDRRSKDPSILNSKASTIKQESESKETHATNPSNASKIKRSGTRRVFRMSQVHQNFKAAEPDELQAGKAKRYVNYLEGKMMPHLRGLNGAALAVEIYRTKQSQ